MIDFATLGEAVEAHGHVVRLVVADVKGSAPREAGTSMLIWADGASGTIGGGRLEHNAIKGARNLIADGIAHKVCRQALGPGLGQCCGGAVTLVYEMYDATSLELARSAVQADESYIRQIEPGGETPPKPLLSHVASARLDKQPPSIRLTKGWLVEPVRQDTLPVYIYGAGHVGRALARVLAPLPQFDVHLSDVREEQFEGVPEIIHQSWDLLPTDIMAEAPDRAAHFIMTPEHDYDLELCHRLLGRRFGYAGLIGSATKWARFRSRLAELGHASPQMDRIQCPIGDPALGKHPQAIAIGVVSDLLLLHAEQTARLRSTA